MCEIQRDMPAFVEKDLLQETVADVLPTLVCVNQEAPAEPVTPKEFLAGIDLYFPGS